MPIISQPTVVHQLVAIQVDVRTMAGKVTYLRLENNAQVGGDLVYDIVGADLQAIMGGTPDATQTRLNDIATAVNHHMVAAGLIQGAVA